MRKVLNLRLVVLGALALGGLLQPAHAANIIYTLTGTGAVGTGPGGAFSGANFTHIGIGNTTNTTTLLSLPAIQLTSLTYNISGVTTGTATVNVPSVIFDASSTRGSGSFGSYSTASGGGVGFSGLDLVGWDMASPIGPISVNFWGGGNSFTDQGTIRLNGWTSATFTAAPYGGGLVPEAPAAAMLLPGLLPVAALALRKRRRSNKSA